MEVHQYCETEHIAYKHVPRPDKGGCKAASRQWSTAHHANKNGAVT